MSDHCNNDNDPVQQPTATNPSFVNMSAPSLLHPTMRGMDDTTASNSVSMMTTMMANPHDRERPRSLSHSAVQHGSGERSAQLSPRLHHPVPSLRYHNHSLFSAPYHYHHHYYGNGNGGSGDFHRSTSLFHSHHHQFSFGSLNGLDLSDRTRREKEHQEEHMSADELRAVLKKERCLSVRLASDLMSLRDAAEASAVEAEADEECRINNLMRRLESLQREKGRIVVELEHEEEMLTNSLMKKLNQLKREKLELEQQIEREHLTNQQLLHMRSQSYTRNVNTESNMQMQSNCSGSGSLQA